MNRPPQHVLQQQGLPLLWFPNYSAIAITKHQKDINDTYVQKHTKTYLRTHTNKKSSFRTMLAQDYKERTKETFSTGKTWHFKDHSIPFLPNCQKKKQMQGSNQLDFPISFPCWNSFPTNNQISCQLRAY